MLISYDIITKRLTTERLPHERCPACGEEGGVEVTLYMRYIQAILPFYGMGRPTGVVCTRCNHVIKNENTGIFSSKKYSPAIANAIREIRARHKRTLWQCIYPWTASILLAGAVAVFLIGALYRNHTAKTNVALLADPQAGDIYKAEVNAAFVGGGSVKPDLSDEYRLVRVSRISDDAMYIVVGRQSVRFSLEDSDWADVSRESDAFETAEIKVHLPSFRNRNGNTGRFVMPCDQMSERQKNEICSAYGVRMGVIGKVVDDNYGRLHVVERNR